jgi:transposase
MGTQHKRDRDDHGRLRYASDLTDAEWAEVGPLIPPAKPGGNKRTVDIREIVNGVMYVLSTGCRWHAIPKDLPPRSTVHDYLERWTCDGTLERIHHTLYGKCHDGPSRAPRMPAALEKDQSSTGMARARRVPTPMVLRQGRRSELRRTTLWSVPRC